MRFWGATTFQNAVSPLILKVADIYDWFVILGIFVITIVIYLSFAVVISYSWDITWTKSESLESIWTIIPTFLLIVFIVPSLEGLYTVEEVHDPFLTVKATGHQWYWNYEIRDWGITVDFDSYLVSSGDYRLLDVDNSLVVPANINIRLNATSADVIHSWTVPSLGVKVDAVPGRINQTLLVSPKLGVLYGQCSEICGYIHSIMPIKLEVVPVDEFSNWIESLGANSN